MKIKTLLFALTLIWASKASAQKHPTSYFEIKSGLLYDADVFYRNLTPEIKSSNSGNFYLGAEYLALGFTRAKDKRRMGIEIDLFRFEKNPIGNRALQIALFGDASGPNELVVRFQQVSGYTRNKFQAQASFFLGQSIFQSEKFDLFVAPLASLAFRVENQIPKTSQNFPTRELDYMLGLGGKLQGRLELSKKIGFVFGTKLMLLDVMVRQERTSNPSLTLRQQRQTGAVVDLLRDDVVLQFGFSFEL